MTAGYTYDRYPKGSPVRMTWMGMHRLYTYWPYGPFGARYDRYPAPDRMHGEVTGYSRDGRCIYVRCMGAKTGSSYHIDFWEPIAS